MGYVTVSMALPGSTESFPLPVQYATYMQRMWSNHTSSDLVQKAAAVAKPDRNSRYKARYLRLHHLRQRCTAATSISAKYKIVNSMIPVLKSLKTAHNNLEEKEAKKYAYSKIEEECLIQFTSVISSSVEMYTRALKKLRDGSLSATNIGDPAATYTYIMEFCVKVRNVQTLLSKRDEKLMSVMDKLSKAYKQSLK